MRPHVNSKVIKRKAIRPQSALPVKMHVITDLRRVLPKESSLFNTFLLNLHTHQDAGRWISVSFPFVLLRIREISTLYNQPETSVGMFWEKNVKWLILPAFSNQFQLYERGFIHTHHTSVSARPHGTPHRRMDASASLLRNANIASVGEGPQRRSGLLLGLRS